MNMLCFFCDKLAAYRLKGYEKNNPKKHKKLHLLINTLVLDYVLVWFEFYGNHFLKIPIFSLILRLSPERTCQYDLSSCSSSRMLSWQAWMSHYAYCIS